MLTTRAIVASALLFAPVLAIADAANHLADRTTYMAPRATVAPVVDGAADDPAWADARWQPLEHRWLGPEFTAADFAGRYKVVWTEERIYLLAEIVDDILIDTHRDPLVQYWDDDCLEIFLDEDHSGGNHQFNHNAFAYHFSLDNRAIDIGTDEKPRDYTDHVQSRWRQVGDRVIWEVSIDVYRDDYVDDAGDNEPVKLTAGKTMGLMVAYCDNDGSALRENFVGSESVPSGPKDRGWIDAGLFGTLILTE
ncbi:MAG: sugar-binding protein [Pseudomonadota bacterium]